MSGIISIVGLILFHLMKMLYLNKRQLCRILTSTIQIISAFITADLKAFHMWYIAAPNTHDYLQYFDSCCHQTQSWSKYALSPWWYSKFYKKYYFNTNCWFLQDLSPYIIYEPYTKCQRSLSLLKISHVRHIVINYTNIKGMRWHIL